VRDLHKALPKATIGLLWRQSSVIRRQ
jgi:hypothetical protein